MRETERRWLLKALREAADELVEEFYDLDPTGAAGRTDDDQRSPQEIAAHLCAAEELALVQLEHLLSGRAASLPVRDVESPPASAAAAALHTLLGGFLRARRRTCLLLWELTPSQWRREGLHPYRGPITVGQLARGLAEHDLEHLWQVRRHKSKSAETISQPDVPWA